MNLKQGNAELRKYVPPVPLKYVTDPDSHFLGSRIRIKVNQDPVRIKIKSRIRIGIRVEIQEQ
jgi:hypothetical protein